MTPYTYDLIQDARSLRNQQALCAEAMRYTLSDIDTYIRGVRGALYRGKDARLLARDYLRLVRDLHDLQERAAELELYGPLCDPQMPIPFRPQMVGQTGGEWVPVN